MADVVVYIACSVDGFIADRSGSVGFLDAFSDALDGFEEFERGVGPAIMGRATFDFIAGHMPEELKKRPHVVMTRRAIEGGLSESVQACSGSAEDAVARARAAAKGNVWVVGGGETIRQFVDADLVDSLRIFTVPILLGSGVPLFPRSARVARSLRLTRCRTFGSGVVEAEYLACR